jgi:hypothetical protein
MVTLLMRAAGEPAFPSPGHPSPADSKLASAPGKPYTRTRNTTTQLPEKARDCSDIPLFNRRNKNLFESK